MTVFPKLCAGEDLQVCRGLPGILSKCFLLLLILCKNGESVATTGHGEKTNDLGNQYHLWLHHAISVGRCP